MTCALLLLAAETSGDVPVGLVIVLMGLGVLVAIGGHLYGSRAVVATGIALLFLGTAAMVVGGLLAFEGGERDPRPPENPSSPDF